MSCLQKVFEWNATVVAHRPKLILCIVTTASLTCLVLSLCLHPLPSFSDPNLGFETRGTELSRRSIAFENLLDRVRSPSVGTKENPVLSKTADIGRSFRGKRSSKGSFIKFCLQPSGEYSQVVMSGRDLWSESAIRAMCRLELKLISSPEYNKLCDRPTKTKNCCPVWSLPNYIAFLHNKTSCLNISKEDISKTKELVEECYQYYFSESVQHPVYYPKRTPLHCRRKKAIFNLIFFHLDSHHKLHHNKLTNVMIILPLAQSSAVLPYYHSLKFSSLNLDGVSVTAINFGVKDALFSETLLADSSLLIIGLGLVAMCFYLYTKALFLTVMTLVGLIYSLSLAYFLYSLVFRFYFFPFINLLSSVVVIGVGGDASLILCKLWKNEEKEQIMTNSVQERLPLDRGSGSEVVSLVRTVYHKSVLPLGLTSLTTAAAFFTSYISSITSIACFGVFSGGVVVSNLAVTWWWMPSCLVLHKKRVSAASKSVRRVGRLVLKPRLLWLLLFPVVSGCAGLVLLHRGGLPVPDRPSLQLFLSSHPIEKFYSKYSHRFWMYRIRANLDVVVLRWLWGVKAVDSGDPTDPGSRGTLHLDYSFNISQPEAQIFFHNFCKNIRLEEWYGGGSELVGGRCFPESLSGWLSRPCLSVSDSPCCDWPPFPPYPPWLYSQCAARAAATVHTSILAHPLAGPYFLHPDVTQPHPHIRILVIEFLSNRTFTTSHSHMEAFYRKVEKWTQDQMTLAPSSASGGWFMSDLALYDLQSSLHRDTGLSVLTAAILVLVLLLIATRDLRLAAASVLTVAGSIVTVAGALVLLDWRLDVLESSTASLAVGLSVDFTIHYALHYKSSKGEVGETLDAVGGPTLACMITSCLAGAVMIPSQVLPYRRVCAFLLVLMPISWLYSTFWFLSLLPPRSSSNTSTS